MPPVAEALDAGEAWSELVDRHAGGGAGAGPTSTGRVVARFPRAAYVELGGCVLALVGPDAPRGPLHLRVPGLVPGALGDEVRLSGGVLRAGAIAIDVGRTARWRAPVPDASRLRAVSRHAADSLTASRGSTSCSDDACGSVAAALDAGDLASVVRRLGGAGPGLTPAGDDVLAGIAVVAVVAGADPEVLGAHLAAARTHAISLAFLRWAARGCSIEPVHDLLAALVAGRGSDVAASQARVAAVGHTSGCDLLLGMTLAFGAIARRCPAA